MKIGGFTFIRNGLKYDYPFRESIRSVLPLVDELVVAVGKSEDDTLKAVQDIDSPKIKIIETIWDDTLRTGGQVLAIETDKAFAAISKGMDWAVYIQGDEVFPEASIPKIRQAMERHKNDLNTEGLLLPYIHFYGSYDYFGISRRWYRREVRIIRQDEQIKSYRDAQGFRKNGRKLNVRFLTDAPIYHYGWVKPPAVQQKKVTDFHRLWHDDKWIETKVEKVTEYDYHSIDYLARYSGKHPEVMLQRISECDWNFNYDHTDIKTSFKDKLLFFIEQKTGWRIGEYRNYRIIGKN